MSKKIVKNDYFVGDILSDSWATFTDILPFILKAVLIFQIPSIILFSLPIAAVERLSKKNNS